MTAQILAVSAADARTELCLSLELGAEPLPATLIASAVRRLCSFMCPCPPFAVVRMACRSLEMLGLAPEELQHLVEDALEDLTACGDLVELSRVAIAGGENQPNWLYCAPPSFVSRPGGRIHIVGIAADNAAFLPSELRGNLKRDGATRYLDQTNDALVTQLKQLGLRELSGTGWMVSVRAESAGQYFERFAKRLHSQGVPGELPELTILAPASDSRTTYSCRWKAPDSETGVFVGRVPQPYGAPLWYLCALSEGQATKSVLLPPKESVERGSDVAWRVQLAIDAVAGRPASYAVTRDEGAVTLSFDFPLPAAVRRRLMFLGARRSGDEVNPFKFRLPVQELLAEQVFLRDYYWFEERAKEPTP